MSETNCVTSGLESAVECLYRNRFPSAMRARRHAVWKTLCRSWFQRWVPEDGRVLEIAPGYCEFINNIRAAERVAVDLNPEARRFADRGVVVYQCSAEALNAEIPSRHFDVAFMSNFLEHCRSRDHLLAVLRAVGESLKEDGRLMILGPNFRYCYREYFDYFDHYLPLTEKAVVEALHLTGFSVEVVKPRTLPFTFRSRLPSWPWLVHVYLRVPFLARLFGAQFFVVARAAHEHRACFIPSPHGDACRKVRENASTFSCSSRGSESG